MRLLTWASGGMSVVIYVQAHRSGFWEWPFLGLLWSLEHGCSPAQKDRSMPQMRSAKHVVAIFLALSFAQTANSGSEVVLSVQGKTLTYDTTVSDGISDGHFQSFLETVKKHPDIKTVNLKSTGGLVWEAQRISEVIIDLGLDTHVEEECASACSTIFLSGTTRTLALGARLGFHRSSWTAEEIKPAFPK
jgi:hypothetical protein